jgi:hypothetical protein
MTRFFFVSLLILFFNNKTFSQVLAEIPTPYNIKTVTFTQGGNNMIPIFSVGDSFEFSFDDLYGNEENYYYTITHCNYNWTKSDLSINEYMQGTDNQRIQDYENSFNTLQIYSHYRLNFPNKFTQLTKSGNYLLSILNNDREIVFSKKFILFEDLVDVPMQIKRARVITDNPYKHNIDFAVKSKDIIFQNPDKNLKVVLFQNGKWNNAIVNIKPQYTIGNDLIFKYDKETQFYAGNEYLFFDNKDVRAATNTIAKVDSSTGLYKSYLYTDSARKKNGYTFYPDINGNYQVRNIAAQNNTVEADYTWVYFVLFSPETPAKSNVYVTGMFNNNSLTAENKMEYNIEKRTFEKAILVKQGFVNYNYTIANNNNIVQDDQAVDGNYFETGNVYTAIVYYRSNTDRYDRVIGRGEANSINITN